MEIRIYQLERIKMSDSARLFDQIWFYPSPANRVAGADSDKGAESFAPGADLLSGISGSSAVQPGALLGGGSRSLLITPGLVGYHVQVGPLSPGIPFPQAAVKGQGQIITGIQFFRKYTLLDQSNKPLPNAPFSESALKLIDTNNLVKGIETKSFKTDANGSWSDHPELFPPPPMTAFPESFEVAIDQKMWYRDKLIVHATQRFVRRKGDDVNGVANHSSLTYHEAVPVTILQ
jgi:hypothetical protein